MLRSAFLVFITGWLVWFWLDKPPAGRFGLPRQSDNVVENFQRAFDMLKAGYPDMAYVYIWSAHYLILSLVGGILVAVLYRWISEHLSRKRMRRQLIPPPRSTSGTDNTDDPPEQPSAPAE